MTNPNTNPDYCKDAEKTALVRLCGVLGVLTENNDLATTALLAATRIERLEKKIPALNVDLAEASMHAYNGEIARMKLEAELARRDEIIARLKAERRWIPVSERLPELPNWVIALTNYNEVFPATFIDDKWYDDVQDELIHTEVTRWMPLPPPEEE